MDTDTPRTGRQPDNAAAPVGYIKTQYVLVGALGVAVAGAVFSNQTQSKTEPTAASVTAKTVTPTSAGEAALRGAPNDAVHRKALGGTASPNQSSGQLDPHATLQAAPDVSVAKVPKPAGPLGRTIAGLYRDVDTLANQKVRLRGTVVRFTGNIQGWNYLHLRDGSGSAAQRTHDVTVTTRTEFVVGQQVELEGTVRQNIDLGMGYHYPVLVAEATLLKPGSPTPDTALSNAPPRTARPH